MVPLENVVGILEIFSEPQLFYKERKNLSVTVEMGHDRIALPKLLDVNVSRNEMYHPTGADFDEAIAPVEELKAMLKEVEETNRLRRNVSPDTHTGD